MKQEALGRATSLALAQANFAIWLAVGHLTSGPSAAHNGALMSGRKTLLLLAVLFMAGRAAWWASLAPSAGGDDSPQSALNQILVTQVVFGSAQSPVVDPSPVGPVSDLGAGRSHEPQVDLDALLVRLVVLTKYLAYTQSLCCP